MIQTERMVKYVQLLSDGAKKAKERITANLSAKEEILHHLKNNPSTLSDISKLEMHTNDQVNVLSRVNRWLDSQEAKTAYSALQNPPKNIDYYAGTDLASQIHRLGTLSLEEKGLLHDLFTNNLHQQHALVRLKELHPSGASSDEICDALGGFISGERKIYDHLKYLLKESTVHNIVYPLKYTVQNLSNSGKRIIGASAAMALLSPLTSYPMLFAMAMSMTIIFDLVSEADMIARRKQR
jgi:hypothetical protein